MNGARPGVLRCAGATDVGCRRERNEDDLVVEPQAGLLAVADGMGGHAAGEVASHVAVTTLRELLVEATAPAIPPRERLRAAVEMANRRILHEIASDPTRSGMGTTVVAALVTPIEVALAHVGDSRAYLLQNGRLERLTSDHSWVQEQVDMGILTSEQARGHPYRNVVTRALGSRSEIEVAVRAIPVQPGDLLLLCSDGLSSMVDDARIGTILSESQGDVGAACSRLIEAAKACGGEDNITVVVAAFA